MKTRLFIAALCGVSLGVLQSTTAFAAVSSDEFVKKASAGSEFEIESSKLALEKSQDPNVKRVAQQMINDHTQSSSSLDQAVQASNLNVSPDNTLDEHHQKMLDKLQSESGNSFNHDYISMQMDAHKRAIALYKDYSQNGNNPSLKSYASQALPTLQEHLNNIEQAQQKG